MSIRIRVAGCVVDGDQIVLVTHEKNGARYQLLPGGGVDDGETLVQALKREFAEETGLEVKPGRLLIVSESIDPRGERHILNLVYAAEMIGGTLKPGVDGTLCDAGWFSRSQLSEVNLFPPIAAELEQCWKSNFEGPVLTLGNVWED